MIRLRSIVYAALGAFAAILGAYRLGHFMKARQVGCSAN